VDKENGNRTRNRKGKVALERVQMARSRGKKRKEKGKSYRGIIRGLKLGIKEKRQEKGEEEICMERKVHIGNKWWKIMTKYSKEMKATRGRIEDAMKENREECLLMGEDFNERTRERGARNWEERRGWMGKENSKTRWRMQRVRD
jgi:hypothetical protein